MFKAFHKGGGTMGFREAVEDGIRTEQKQRMVYYIPCENCKQEVRRTSYSRKLNYLCDYCKGIVKRKQKVQFDTNIKTKAEIRFDKAIKEIEKQVDKFDEYKKSIEIARKRLEKYGSVPEAMVAIELIRLGYSIIPQQKIDKYKVDFLLPKEKIIIEVDGCVFHSEKNLEREAIIQMTVGLEWKIIHIPAEKIRNNIRKLIKVIETFE